MGEWESRYGVPRAIACQTSVESLSATCSGLLERMPQALREIVARGPVEQELHAEPALAWCRLPPKLA